MLTSGTLVSIKYFTFLFTKCSSVFSAEPIILGSKKVTVCKHNRLFYGMPCAFFCPLLAHAMYMQLLFPTNLGGY